MPDAELATRTGVELVNTGSWKLLSGSWNPNRADILAAVEASKCPAVRRPKLKLGHLDPRFNTAADPVFDGTPSLGWFDNLRATDDGNTLLGDQVALPWLSAVQAAAWPDRSVEGNYRHRCALGHVHPFVITAVSLLGETPPGIPTLKSIRSVDDLPAALGIAASGPEVPEGAEHVQATVRAAAEVHTSAMIALVPTVEDAERLALAGGEPANELHLTLAYLGEAAALGAGGRQDVIDQVSTVANGLPTIEADIFAVTAFNPGPGEPDPCLVWGVTGEVLDAVHDLVDETLHLVDAPIPPQLRPWAAHITAAYTGDLTRLGDLATRIGPVTFDRIRLAFAGEFIDIPLMPWPGEDGTETDALPVAASAAVDIRARVDALRAARVKETPVTAASEPATTAPDVAPVPAEPLAPELPAAEPEQENPDPKEEDPVSTTDLSPIGSRLGLNGDISVDSIAEAIDALKAKAEAPPTIIEPAPELVAASAAAAERTAELEKTVEKLAGQLTSISTELAAAKQEKADTVKASVIQAAAAAGKFTPAEREQWERDYDEAPGVTTRILASIAPGTAVPVTATGVTGESEPVLASSLDVSEGSALDAWAKQLGIDTKELSY